MSHVLLRMIARVVVLQVLVSGLASLSRAQTFVGSVKLAEGSAVVRRGGSTTSVRIGMQLQVNDVLATSADARVGVMFEDGTRLSLGPNTELTIDRFVYQPAEGKFAMLLNLARGVLAFVSGRIARVSPESVSLQTPVGIIGLRGTNFVVSIEK